MLHELTDGLVLTTSQFIGIPLALVGAVFLALGTQYQNRGVRKVEANTQSAQGRGLSVKQLALLLARPSWVAGTAMLGLAILLQLASLYFSPIIVVQPLGAIALVITAIVNSRVNKVKMNRGTVIAITMSVAGVFMFVGVAAFTTTNMPINDLQLIIILIALAVLLLVLAVLLVVLKLLLPRVAKQLVSEEGSLLGRHRVAVEEGGVRLETPKASGFYSWSGVLELVDAPAYLVLFVDVASAVMVPKRAFADDAAARSFLEDARRRWEAGRRAAASAASPGSS